MTRIIDWHLKKVFEKRDSSVWRKDRYYNEECDVVLKYYNRLLLKLYDNYSGMAQLPGAKKSVSLKEIQQMCSDMEMYNEDFVEREVNIRFNLSM